MNINELVKILEPGNEIELKNVSLDARELELEITNAMLSGITKK